MQTRLEIHQRRDRAAAAAVNPPGWFPLRLLRVSATSCASPSAAPPTSDEQQKKISTTMNHLSLRKQQLLERKKLLCIFLELQRRTDCSTPEESASHQNEIKRIDEELTRLMEAKAGLQESRDHLGDKEKVSKKEVHVSDVLKVKGEKISKKEGHFGNDEKTADSGLSVIYVGAPPSVPAPTVILDLEKLPACPCKTQCPECRQFITTETSKSIGSLTWLMCVMTAVIGCVGGCCLLPFCMNRFKNTKHTCPKCRSAITTVKKL